MAAALALVRRIQRGDPTHPRAHFAAAQLHAELKQWAESEAAYVSATSFETDLAQRARAWFGAGELPTCHSLWGRMLISSWRVVSG